MNDEEEESVIEKRFLISLACTDEETVQKWVRLMNAEIHSVNDVELKDWKVEKNEEEGINGKLEHREENIFPFSKILEREVLKNSVRYVIENEWGEVGELYMVKISLLSTSGEEMGENLRNLVELSYRIGRGRR